MRFFAAHEGLYKEELMKYFARLSDEEIMIKAPTGNILEKYTRNARYAMPAGLNRVKFQVPMNVFFVFNRDVEYNLPHTLGPIIVIPEGTKDVIEVVTHELVHIYFHHFRTPMIADFCKSKGIRGIRRDRIKREITNPDTYYNSCLIYGAGSLFVALIDVGGFFIKKYYYCDNGGTRDATPAEIKYYDLVLPYVQNDHPEEMLAELITSKIDILIK